MKRHSGAHWPPPARGPAAGKPSWTATATATAEMAGLNVLTYLTANLDACGRNSGKPCEATDWTGSCPGKPAPKTGTRGRSHPARLTPPQPSRQRRNRQQQADAAHQHACPQDLSSAVGRSSSVASLTNGVRRVVYREIVDCAMSKISAHTSSTMFCRRHPQVTTSAARKVSSRGRPSPLSRGSLSSSVTRYSVRRVAFRLVLICVRTATASPL